MTLLLKFRINAPQSISIPFGQQKSNKCDTQGGRQPWLLVRALTVRLGNLSGARFIVLVLCALNLSLAHHTPSEKLFLHIQIRMQLSVLNNHRLNPLLQVEVRRADDKVLRSPCSELRIHSASTVRALS